MKTLLTTACAAIAILASGSAFAQQPPRGFEPINPGQFTPGPNNPPSNYPQPQPPAYNQTPAGGGEMQDFGVRPTNQLHNGAMHGPTPTSIPGGQVISTQQLGQLMQGGQVLVFDVLGANETLPNATVAVPLHQAGSFNDQISQSAAQGFQQMTGGRKDVPMVFYCQSSQCWMSYNAALRAINLGYTKVLWYRGGLEAWKAAGGPTQPYPSNGGGNNGGGYGPGPGPGQNPNSGYGPNPNAGYGPNNGYGPAQQPSGYNPNHPGYGAREVQPGVYASGNIRVSRGPNGTMTVED